MSIRSRYQTPGSARRFGSHRLVGRQVMDDDINEVLGKSRFSHCFLHVRIFCLTGRKPLTSLSVRFWFTSQCYSTPTLHRSKF